MASTSKSKKRLFEWLRKWSKLLGNSTPVMAMTRHAA